MGKETPILNNLKQIPGVGNSIAENLLNIGINSVNDLKGKDPEILYHNSNKLTGTMQDRCLLYVFRCAIYYAENKKHESEKLKWWWWKDKP